MFGSIRKSLAKFLNFINELVYQTIKQTGLPFIKMKLSAIINELYRILKNSEKVLNLSFEFDEASSHTDIV